jgi:hypothetical protein
MGVAIASAGMFSGGGALAQDAGAGAVAVAAASSDQVLTAHVAPIDDAELGAISGGQEVIVSALSNQQLTASNSGTVEANQVTTGNVEFSTGAYSGIGNFVVNTGNNNNLQGVIGVNIATGGQ